MNKWSFPVFEYGEKWRTYRRLFHEFFNVATVKRYDEDQRKATSRLLQNLSERPADFRRHVQLATGSIALSIMYGIQVDSPEDPYFRIAEEANKILEEALVPGAFPAEIFPIRELSLLQCLLYHETKPNFLDSSLRPIVAPRWWCTQLRGTRLQVFDGQHNATDAIRHGTT